MSQKIVENIDREIRKLNREISKQKKIWDETRKDMEELAKQYLGKKDDYGMSLSHYDDPAYNGMYQRQLTAFIEMDNLKKQRKFLRSLKK